jgi:ribosomal protein S18 acetylase RimI-like enzyme
VRGQIPIERLSTGSDPQAFADCARLHAELIHHGALPLLGERFLAELYRGLAGARRSGVWRLVRDGRTVGFLAGCADARRTSLEVLLRRGPRLARLGAMRLADAAIRAKVLAVVRYLPRRTETAAPTVAAELLAIAVDPAIQGSGGGRGLVERFEAQLRGWDVDRYVVSTNRAEVGSNAFYRALGFEDSGQVEHHDLVLQTYRKVLA